MNKKRYIKYFLCLLVFIVLGLAIFIKLRERDILPDGYIAEGFELDDVKQEKVIKEYLEGNRDNVIKNEDGYDSITLEDNTNIIILGENGNFNGYLEPIDKNSKKINDEITYLGEDTKPPVDFTSTHCNTTGNVSKVNFKISTTLKYRIYESRDIYFGDFKSILQKDINYKYTLQNYKEENIPSYRCIKLRGLPRFDVYKYDGTIRKGTLYSPKGYIIFMVLSPE